MITTLDAVILARIQFAFTVSFHIVFPAFTIGLASFLSVLEWRWLRSRETRFKELYQLWAKIFAVCFGMGVVSGLVMSYQFGTNWSFFSDKIGNVIGPLLGYEVLTAFFLEASFLGIMLFGWNRVSEKMHFASTCIVAVGTLISAFWILSANSWMQTPAGFSVAANGLYLPASWLQIIFNPSFPYRFAHMVTAAYLTTAFVVGGVGALYLLRQQHIQHAKTMLNMALLMAFIVAPIQLLIGHEHGTNTLQHQPIKVAAMEGNWQQGANKPLLLFALPDEQAETNHYTLSLPGGASWVLTGDRSGVIPGLQDVTAAERPPVALVFWSFRVMVGLGLAMIFTGFVGAWLYYRGCLYDNKLFLRWCVAMIPAGFLAVLAGWFVTEVGRQPYAVYGFLTTAQSVSPVIAEQVLLSLSLFLLVYLSVFSAGILYMIKPVFKGPPTQIDDDNYYDHSATAAVVEFASHHKE